MVDNQHRKIVGYRDLSEEEIKLMNECKEMAQRVGELCDKIAMVDGSDDRWWSIARTDLQKGFMALIRSIAQPATF
jgi:hypothetical protein